VCATRLAAKKIPTHYAQRQSVHSQTGDAFQWCPLEDVGLAGKKIKKIENALKREKFIKVIHDVPKWNYVQTLLSLGDRRVGEILLTVNRLEGNWAQALKEVNINPDFYVYRQKQSDEILPWDIIDLSVSKKALMKEFRKAVPEI